MKKGIGLALNATVFLSTQVTKHKQQGIIGSAPGSQKLGWKKRMVKWWPVKRDEKLIMRRIASRRC